MDKQNIKFSTKATIVLLISIIILFFIVWVYQYTGYLELVEAEKSISKQIENEFKVKENLIRQKNYQNSDAYIEEIARKELNMLKSNEMKVISK